LIPERQFGGSSGRLSKNENKDLQFIGENLAHVVKGAVISTDREGREKKKCSGCKISAGAIQGAFLLEGKSCPLEVPPDRVSSTMNKSINFF